MSITGQETRKPLSHMELLRELERRRVLMSQYRQWLSEFPDITLVLANMQAEIEGQSLCASNPPSPNGPWGINGLRSILRSRRDGR
jgi:hypothetical protein